MATDSNAYVGAAGPGGIQVWRPSVTTANTIQSLVGTGRYQGTSPGISDGGQQTTTDGSGNVYAAALFVTATCQSSDAVGNVVRADSAANSVTTVTCYQPYPSVGIIVKKTDSTDCVVQTYGLCTGVLSGLSPNNKYFVGGSGAPTAAANLPSDTAYVQLVGFAVQPNSFFVQPSGILIQRSGASSTPTAGNPAGDTVQTQGGYIYVGNGPPDGSITPNVNDIWYDQNAAVIYTAA